MAPNRRTSTVVLILSIIVAVAAFAWLLLSVQGSPFRRTPQMLNGHQSSAQKHAKRAQAIHDLTVIARTHNRVTRAKVCDQLPEGFGQLGVCARAPAYLHSGRAPPIAPAAYVVGYVVHGIIGIDTSHWDDCNGAEPGPGYWIVAVGDGSYVDPCAGRVYHQLKARGLPRTTYYFVRQYLDPTWSADHYVGLILQMGANDSMVPVNDAEAITSCAWIHTFDNRVRLRLHLARIMDYSSPGLWPGCSDARSLAYVAGYGPLGQRLAGLAGWIIQQYSDGHVGPYPHCLGVCGDMDVLPGSLAQLLAVARIGPPPPPPIAVKWYHVCSYLGQIEYWKAHGGRGHVTPRQHRQAVTMRVWLRQSQHGCTSPGWRQHPTTRRGTVPYRYPHRKGALA